MKFTKITKTSKNGEIPSFFPGWLEERFKNHYAQIGTINTLKLKNSCRDVARFKLGSVPPDIEKLAKGFLVPPQGVSDKSFILGYASTQTIGRLSKKLYRCQDPRGDMLQDMLLVMNLLMSLFPQPTLLE